MISKDIFIIHSLVTKSCPSLCDPVDCNTPGFPVLHYLLGVCSNLCPLSYWMSHDYLTISFSAALFSLCFQSFLTPGSFPVSWLFTSGGQSVGASASVLPMNTVGWFPLRLTGLISLQSKGLSRVFSNTTVQKHQFFGTQTFFMIQLSYPWMTTGKTIALTRQTFVSKVMSLLFNTLSSFVRAFLPGSKYLLISWLQSPSAVILEPKRINKIC